MSVDQKTPQVPLTLEGSSVLHQMFHVEHSRWRELSAKKQKNVLAETAKSLGKMKGTAAYAMLGHKAEFMLVHFRDEFSQLLDAQREVNALPLREYLRESTSYVSVVELGLYESSVKTFKELAAMNLETGTEAWDTELKDVLDRQRDAMKSRLYPEIPPAKYICFYPMDRRRGEHKNWYMLPIEERQRQMHEHGLVGRKYAGKVKQIITGSIGLDDWEWGVDLFADDPIVFKKLIYEMRFDEVSAMYAAFGTFYVGLRCEPKQLGKMLFGQ